MATGATPGLVESLVEGREVRLRPHGFGRFPAAAFLMFWLCGWLAGEAIVAFLLVRGAIALITGEPPAEGKQPLELGPALAAGVFMLFWLAFWTAGGLAAMHQLLKLVWSEDRLTANPGGLTVVHCIGPFRSRRELPRDAIRQVYVPLGSGELRAQTTSGTVRLATLGTLEERLRLAELLRSELALAPQPEGSDGVIPEGWQEIIDPEGGVSLVHDPKTRRIQARIAGVAAAVVAVVALALLTSMVRDPDLAVLAAMASAAAFGLGWMALVLARGRTEWRIGPGRLRLRRRFGTRVRELFAATSLELTDSRDSDGDRWFALEAVAPEAGGPGTRSTKKTRRTVTRAIHDPTEPRRLGEWLAHRAGVPFRNLATEEHDAPDLAALTARLESSGRLGRLAARLLRRSS